MKSKGFLLDTTVLIDFFRGQESAVDLITKLADEFVLAVSPVTIAEIYAGIRAAEIHRVEELLNTLLLFQINGSVARRAGLYQRDYRRKGITLALADGLIAATAVENDLTLVTKNLRHFPMPELMVITH
jgi:predicted nucleic acid-binding protein